MKILLIMPYPIEKDASYFNNVYPLCLSLQQIAALIPEEHDVEIIDERLTVPNYDDEYDLVGISSMTFNSLKAYELADYFRKRGSKVILGGYHPTVMSSEAKGHADSVVIGESELIWPELLKDFKNNDLKPFYKAERLVEPEAIPAAIHNIERYKEQRVESIQASRGCPVGCKFCAMQNIEGTKFRGRPIKNVIDEINSIDKKRLYFVDASLTINPNFSKNLFREMKHLNKRFSAMGNVNVPLKDDEFLKLASEAGCTVWLIGLESFSQDTINDMGKTTNKIKEYSKAIDRFHDYGIKVIGSFMFGFDTDTKDTFKETYRAMRDMDIDIAEFNVLTPLPGTGIFRQFEQENRLLTRDWSKYTDDGGVVVFQPKNMTPQELLNGVDYVYNKFNSLTANLKKFIRTKEINMWNIKRSFSRYF